VHAAGGWSGAAGRGKQNNGTPVQEALAGQTAAEFSTFWERIQRLQTRVSLVCSQGATAPPASIEIRRQCAKASCPAAGGGRRRASFAQHHRKPGKLRGAMRVFGLMPPAHHSATRRSAEGKRKKEAQREARLVQGSPGTGTAPTVPVAHAAGGSSPAQGHLLQQNPAQHFSL